MIKEYMRRAIHFPSGIDYWIFLFIFSQEKLPNIQEWLKTKWRNWGGFPVLTFFPGFFPPVPFPGDFKVWPGWSLIVGGYLPFPKAQVKLNHPKKGGHQLAELQFQDNPEVFFSCPGRVETARCFFFSFVSSTFFLRFLSPKSQPHLNLC